MGNRRGGKIQVRNTYCNTQVSQSQSIKTVSSASNLLENAWIYQKNSFQVPHTSQKMLNGMMDDDRVNEMNEEPSHDAQPFWNSRIFPISDSFSENSNNNLQTRNQSGLREETH